MYIPACLLKGCAAYSLRNFTHSTVVFKRIYKGSTQKQSTSKAIFNLLFLLSSIMNLHTSLWPFIIIGEILMYGVFPILVNLSKTGEKIPFLSASFNFSTEALKLQICMVILWFESRTEPMPSVSMKTALPFSVPALLYCINNNLSVFMQTQMDPATYMVLGNLKILFTAALYKFFFRKEMNNKQLVAMALLTCGGILNSSAALTSQTARSLSEIHVTMLGLVMLCSYCFISAFSSVFTEFIFKKDDRLSVYFQNAILYSFGMVFSLIGWLVQANNRMVDTGDNQGFNLFDGYSVFTWALIFTQAPTGLIMSLIMKYQNNIVRLFIIAAAPLITTVLSSMLFGLQIHAEFVISAACIVIAAVLYNQPGNSKEVAKPNTNAC